MSTVNQTPEAQAFLDNVAALPKGSSVTLDTVLAPSLEFESQLRRLFAQDRSNQRLSDPYVNLVSIYDAPESANIRTTFARDIKSEEDRNAKFIFPLPDERRRQSGTQCVVETIDQFRKNWSIFTEGSLSQLTDWNNVIAAGGSVLACMLPLSKEDGASRRTIRKFYHSTGYPTSDIDLFIWGLNAEQAEVKINQIFEAVRDSVPWDVTCVRTKHAISIHSQYPYRSVQIVLRLYHSPAEILAGFDIDTSCVAYDGKHVLANPRSIVALMRQANTVDMTRRSPSYEIRLAKYAARGFEVYTPELRRADVDPTIYERSLPRISGLARLLVLEKLSKPESRVSYLESRRALRSNNLRHTSIYSRRMRRRFKGDLKASEEIAGLDFNDYDVTSLHIPYGPGWNAKRIEKLVYSSDLGMNSTFNPKNKNRRLHRHVAFFGTMPECIEDLCEYCPAPKNDEERSLQEEEDKNYIRGRITFIEEDPGRQSMTGSFKPIDVGEWSEQAYLGTTELFFNAIASNNRAAVQEILASPDFDVNRRDHVGRTALHVAILASAHEICSDLIAAGARITARLADGRTTLHLAAFINPPNIVQQLLARSAYNAEKLKEAEADAKMRTDAETEEDDDSESERPSSEDDWSSEEDDDKKPAKKSEQPKTANEAPVDADVPDDNTEQPDILEIDALDWDIKFTPLLYAILGGHIDVVNTLINAGADPKAATKVDELTLHPLSLTILNADDGRASELIECLIRKGASAAQADNRLLSVFHAFVCSDRTALIQKILEVDHSASSAINVPTYDQLSKLTYPLVSAIERGNSAVVALLLAYGAKAVLLPDDLQRARNMLSSDLRRWRYAPQPDVSSYELNYLESVVTPAEASLVKQNYTFQLLTKLGLQVSIPINLYFDNGRYREESRMSLLDAVENQIEELKKALVERPPGDILDLSVDGLDNLPETPKTFIEFRKCTYAKLAKYRQEKKDNPENRIGVVLSGSRQNQHPGLEEKKQALAYYEEMLASMKELGAKTYSELFAVAKGVEKVQNFESQQDKETRPTYQYISSPGMYNSNPILPHQWDQYDALFEACWTGDDARIEELCLPRKGKKAEKEPIQITVNTKEFPPPPRKPGVYVTDSRHSSGDGVYDPFSVAIIARKWNTARLVLAIATAQYKAPSEKSTEGRFGAGVTINLDDGDSDDSASESGDEDDDDMDVDADATAPISLVDLASRDSAIQCNVPPSQFFTRIVSPRISAEGKQLGYLTLWGQVCANNDLEAFVNICDMAKSLPEPREPDLNCLLSAIQRDAVAIVDEIIRRTGLGIDIEQFEEGQDDKEEADHSAESKLYLGLTVHGKKRKDLAKHGENVPYNQITQIPLLWLAIRNGSQKVIEYLSGPNVSAAYRFYVTTQSTDRAKTLRKREADLDQVLPRLLGVSANNRRESALTAALIGPKKENKLEMIKKVLALIPSQAKNFLHSSLILSGWTPLHLAVIENLDKSIIDFLLNNGLTPTLQDRAGRNIFHLACLLNNVEILEYLMGRLPQDVTNALLLQKAFKTESTPLMLAVESCCVSTVRVLLRSGNEAVKASLSVRNASGFMPLHFATSLGNPDMCTAIIEVIDTDLLHVENGVGETPLETAMMRWLADASRARYKGRVKHGYGHDEKLPVFPQRGNINHAIPPDADSIAKEIDSLQSTRADLAQRGKLVTNKTLSDAIDAYLVYLKDKQATAPKSKSDEKPAAESTITSSNRIAERQHRDFEATYQAILAAVQRSPNTRRQLVHLADVQHSVMKSLDAVNKKQEEREMNNYAYQRSSRRQFQKAKEIPNEAKDEAVQKIAQWQGVLGWASGCRSVAI